MLDYIDYAPKLREGKAKARIKFDEQRRLQHQISVVMSGVKGDPKWKVYADHIQALYERAFAVTHSVKERLGDPLTFLPSEENVRLKLQAAYNQGKAEGYKGALDVITDLIDRGKEPEPLPPEEKISY